MRRETAVRHIREIHARLVAANGIIPTPGCAHAHYHISRVELFGSMATGNPQKPRDVDILVYGEPLGGYTAYTEGGGIRLDLRSLQLHGWERGVESWRDAYKWLTRGMRGVRRHDAELAVRLPTVTVQIYPQFLFGVAGADAAGNAA